MLEAVAEALEILETPVRYGTLPGGITTVRIDGIARRDYSAP